MPSGSKFYYDKDFKKWVNKDAGASSEETKPLAPPPIVTPSTSLTNKTPDISPPQPNVSSTHPTNQPVNSVSAVGKRKNARSRYVDVINPNATASEINSFVPSLTNVPSLSGGTQPKIMMVCILDIR